MTDNQKFPMPFLVEVDTAAEHCLRGLEAGKSVISFPWQLAWPTRTLGRYLPRTLWRLLSRMSTPS